MKICTNYVIIDDVKYEIDDDASLSLLASPESIMETMKQWDY